ncbi:signal recognition particle-docking protein FtsY [Amphritea balenae]|uniref:Signal recognition particle receptor FtsY n=1 Tax=Amphritea balenae TaxID=452629 RepID=A0A3P1SPK5_9GAMM|nr:signal recognition particle-docking protein FtsY [Amphritea balenae]RRC98959.1 signal recognition particle-docking protein FtsY [Amphritea balenae]GGK63246.1 signal recognition particle receptor FtsY [Amphritea balenae]
MFKKLKSLFNSDQKPAQEEQTPALDNNAEETLSEQQSTPQAEPLQEPAQEVEQELTQELTQESSSDSEQSDDASPTAPVAEEPLDEAPAEQTATEEVPVEEALVETTPETEVEELVVEEPVTEESVQEDVKPPESEKKSFFGRIKSGLSRTKANLTEGLGALFLGAKEIDDDLLEEIETHLIMADVGVEATTEIIGKLTDRVSRKQLADADALYAALKEELAALLDDAEEPLDLNASKGPFVLLMVGVNGVGKTTTIGKLAKKYQAEGKSVMLAAGDTFRAAAVEQLQVWGERNDVPVVAQHTGADSASVLYDALQSAQAKNVDVVIADTAGRLQNKENLMQELEKVVRVMKKLDPEAPHEVMLVLDAGTGQNAMSQAKLFKEAVGVTGLSLTKLDGTAKGGIIFAIAKQLELPIRYIGVGEQIDDLRPFKAKEFVSALFD